MGTDTYLMHRKLEADNLPECTIQIELLNAVEVQVNVRDSTGTVIWCRHTKDGETALDMYYHPWFHGFKEGGRINGNHVAYASA